MLFNGGWHHRIIVTGYVPITIGIRVTSFTVCRVHSLPEIFVPIFFGYELKITHSIGNLDRMMISGQNPERSDARDDDSSNAADSIKKLSNSGSINL